ncbi:Hypothetical protein A7982_04226 [Minicystis rosea]|nr:Hypothetical protein A7982_04226 [Minicystis rosea]
MSLAALAAGSTVEVTHRASASTRIVVVHGWARRAVVPMALSTVSVKGE